MQTLYVVNPSDNVGVAITALSEGAAQTVGGRTDICLTLQQALPAGHKAAIHPIACGDDIIKYGTVIGKATQSIQIGEWVHLHNMKSNYDERSSSIDPVTGMIKDTVYE